MSDADYEVLGVSSDADRQTVKQAYFEKIKRFPPDKAPEEFKKIRKAYETVLKKAKVRRPAQKGLQKMMYQGVSDYNPKEMIQELRQDQSKLSIPKLVRLTF